MLLPLLCLVASAGGFEKNLGQTDAQVRYLLRSRDVSVFLTDRETVFRTSSGSSIFMESAGKPIADSVASSTITSYVGPRERWREDVPVFDRIRRRDVFPGIDIVHYGAEYDFVVAPGANPRAIAMRFRGQKSLRIDEAGSLVFDNDLQHKRPVAYQMDETGRKTSVESWFQLRGDVVTFGVGDYDSSRELVIDPEFEAVRFHGGSGDDSFIDGGMRVGVTNSIEFPWVFAEPRGGFDIFFRDGVTSVYFGGKGDERPLGIAAVERGFLIYGETTSTDLPTGVLRSSTPVPPPFQSVYGGGESDGFVLLVRGQASIVAGYVGGRGRDRVVAATRTRVFVQTDSTDLSAPAFGVPPSRNYIFDLDEPWTARYFPGPAITAASDMEIYPGVSIAGTEDGEVLQFASSGAVTARRKVLDGSVVQVRTSTAGWGVLVASDNAMVRLHPETLALERTYALTGSTKLNDLLPWQNYAILAGRTTAKDIAAIEAPQTQYGGGESDGFFSVIDLESGDLKVWSYAGGTGDDEVRGVARLFDGTWQLVGTSTDGWGGAQGYGGVDAFAATLRLPLLPELPVPQLIGKAMQVKMTAPAGIPLQWTSEDALRLAVADSDAGSAWVQSLEGSGVTGLMATSPGLWPAKYRVRHFIPEASFAALPASIALEELVVPVRVEYALPPGARADASFVPGSEPARYEVYSANPAVARPWPDDAGNLVFAKAGSQQLLVAGYDAGQTEIRLRGEAPVGARTSIAAVSVNNRASMPGGEECIVLPGYSTLNRPAPASPTDEMVTLRSERPGDLTFASDILQPVFVDELTVYSNTRIRIAASSSAKKGTGIVYSYPGSSRAGGRVGCRVGSPALDLMPFVSELQLRDGPQRFPFALREPAREPIPVQLIPPRVASSDPSVIQVEVLPDWSILLTPKKLGSSTIRLERAGLEVMNRVYTVRDGRSVLLPEVRVGRDLQTSFLPNGGLSGVDELTVESDDPSRVLLSTASDEPGRAKVVTKGRVFVHALGDSGTVTLRAYGGGFSPTTGVVRLYPSSVGFEGLWGDTVTVWERQEGVLWPAYFALFEGPEIYGTVKPATTQPLRPGVAPARLRFASDDPSIAPVEFAGAEIAYPQTPVIIKGVRPGETMIRVQADGFPVLPRLAKLRAVVLAAVQ